MTSVGEKRTLDDSGAIPPVAKHHKREQEREQESWDRLFPELKAIIFNQLYQSEGIGALLVLRLVHWKSKTQAEAVFFSIHHVNEQEGHEMDAARLEAGVASVYLSSSSRTFLSSVRSLKPFRARTGPTEEQSVFKGTTEECLQRLIATYPYPCLHLDVDSLFLLDQYRQYVQEKYPSTPFKPKTLILDWPEKEVHHELALDHEVNSECPHAVQVLKTKYYPEYISVAGWIHYKKLKPLLTDGLRVLEIKFFWHFTAFDYNFDEFTDADEIKRIFLDTILEGLVDLKLEFINDFFLDEKDVICLNRYAPNLRHLTLKKEEFSGFLQGILKNPLMSQLESFYFTHIRDDVSDERVEPHIGVLQN